MIKPVFVLTHNEQPTLLKWTLDEWWISHKHPRSSVLRIPQENINNPNSTLKGTSPVKHLHSFISSIYFLVLPNKFVYALDIPWCTLKFFAVMMSEKPRSEQAEVSYLLFGEQPWTLSGDRLVSRNGTGKQLKSFSIFLNLGSPKCKWSFDGT